MLPWARRSSSSSSARQMPRRCSPISTTCRTKPIPATFMHSHGQCRPHPGVSDEGLDAAAVLAGGFIATCLAASFALADDLAVSVVNRSEPELCAEKDNVALNSPRRGCAACASRPFTLPSSAHRRRSLGAGLHQLRHVARPLLRGSGAAGDVLRERADFWLTGYTYPSFWRPATVPVQGGRPGGAGAACRSALGAAQ